MPPWHLAQVLGHDARAYAYHPTVLLKLYAGTLRCLKAETVYRVGEYHPTMLSEAKLFTKHFSSQNSV
jgi:hypothetical protein